MRPRSVSTTDCELRNAPLMMATGVDALRCSSSMRRASRSWCMRLLLDGLYMTTTKSPRAAASTLFVMISHGTSRSLMLRTAKSVISGEPIIDAHELSADTPGTTSTGRLPDRGSQPISASVS